MRSALLVLVHFNIFLGLYPSIKVLQYLLDISWILLCWLDYFFILFFFANWLWMFVLIALSFSADWLWISLSDWLLIHYLHCWWWFECIFSWRLVEVSSNVMIVQKVHWIWANSLIIHEIVCIQRISLILIFMTIIYLPFAKSEVSLTILCWERIFTKWKVDFHT